MNNEERTKEIFARAEKKKKTRRRNIVIIGASLAATLVVCLQLFLFLPYPSNVRNISAYKSSEYYSLIKGIEPITRKVNRYKNNWEALKSSLALKGSGSDNYYTDREGTNQTYVETTDLQTEGITEGDRLKRTEKYVYYLSLDGVLYVDSFEDGELCDRGFLYLSDTMPYCDFNDSEIYLDGDLNTVIAVIKSIDGGYGYNSAVVYIDVSSPQTPTIKSTTKISGTVISSRMKDEKLYVLTKFSFGRDFDFDNKSLYIPSFVQNDETTLFSADELIVPENPTERSYVTAYEFTDETVTSKIALLSSGNEFYASKDNVFVYTTRRESPRFFGRNDNADTVTCTKLSRISYGDGLAYKNSYTVEGLLNDKFSLDEKDGILRIVATVNPNDTLQSNASLYCIDVESGNAIAELKNFAPQGEGVRSVRFDGDKVYVCTSKKQFIYNTDPVFAIDLSDLENITAKDTGEISGYSMFLRKFKGGALLGLGYGETDYLKVEIYREGENGVECITAYEDRYSMPATEYKSYYINAEKGLIGIASRSNDGSVYRVLRLEGDKLTECAKVGLYGYSVNQINAVRAFENYGKLYIFDGSRLQITGI